MRTEAAATATPVTPDMHDTKSHQRDTSTQDPSALNSCFPSSFVPFLRSNRREVTFNSLLAYWSEPENVKYTRQASTLKFSFGIALDRALQGDWEMASAFLLNGAFVEQCQRSGGLDNVIDVCLNISDGRDRGKLFGLYFGALRASKAKKTLLRYVETKVDKKQLAIIHQRSDMRKSHATAAKQKLAENEFDSSEQHPRISPASIVICYQEQASDCVEDEHEFVISPSQEIRLVFAEYAKTVRKVPLRSLRFSFPIHLPELEGMDKTAAEHLTFEGLGLDNRRIRVFCTAAESVEPPREMPTEMKTPMATSTPAHAEIPEISPLAALLTPDRPEPAFVERRVKYSEPLITAVNSQQVMTAPTNHRALVSPGTPDVSPAYTEGLVEASPFPSHLHVGFPNIMQGSYDSAEEPSGKPQNIHRPRSNIDSLCMLSNVATSLATN